MDLVWAFVGFAVFTNGIPHFVRGITGEWHMTPFRRRSSPVANVVWGLANCIAGMALLSLVERWAAPGVSLSGLVGITVVAVGLALFWSNPEARLPWHRD